MKVKPPRRIPPAPKKAAAELTSPEPALAGPTAAVAQAPDLAPPVPEVKPPAPTPSPKRAAQRRRPVPPSLDRPRRILPEVIQDEEPPTQSEPVVAERAGDQPPTSPDVAIAPKIDVGWALTLKIVESARNESERDSQADPDGAPDLGDVSGDAVDDDIDRAT